jgi:hypothetical protein
MGVPQRLQNLLDVPVSKLLKLASLASPFSTCTRLFQAPT